MGYKPKYLDSYDDDGIAIGKKGYVSCCVVESTRAEVQVLIDRYAKPQGYFLGLVLGKDTSGISSQGDNAARLYVVTRKDARDDASGNLSEFWRHYNASQGKSPQI